MSSRRALLLFLLVLVLAPWSPALSSRAATRPTYQQLGPCSGTPALGKCNEPSKENLDCLGMCPTETTCRPKQFTSGQAQYWACACVDSSGGATESSCCHLIVYTGDNGTPAWGARGSCPQCGSQGSCVLNPAGRQAICN